MPIDSYRIGCLMNNRFPFTTLAIAALIASACSDGIKEESPGEVLARDSSLASELKQADTSAFAEAADVAMAFDPDSMLPPADAVTPAAPPRPLPTVESPAVATPVAEASRSSVPMRVERSPAVVSRPSPPPAPAPARVPAARTPMRPAPATIHADPLPRPLPASPVRTATVVRADPRANEILATVPGAALPPVGSDEPCASPGAPSQRRCLMLHLARSDVVLDRTYQALITDMKREAGTPRGAREPETVHQLRVSQRAWLVYRDTECRRRNRGREGPLWAPVRAQCLGEFSGNREAELSRALRQRQGR